MAKVVFAVTTSYSLSFLDGIVQKFRDEGHEVIVISGGEQEALCNFADQRCIQWHWIKMARNPSPLRDLLSLIAWVRILWQIRPDITVIGTPKASLIGNLAAFMCKVRTRIMISHGLRLEGEGGIRRYMLTQFEALSHLLATHTMAVSNSLRERLIELNINTSKKITVCHHGSANGIDIRRFRSFSKEEVESTRMELGFSASDWVVGFIGRITPDKGVGDLLDAMLMLEKAWQLTNIQAVFIGRPEGKEGEELVQRIQAQPNCTYLGYREDIPELMASFQVLCLPSSREGYPTVVLEAGAVKTPTIGTSVTGTKDAIVNEDTGIIVDYGNVRALAQTIHKLYSDPEKLELMGQNAQHLVHSRFKRSEVSAAYFDEIMFQANLNDDF